MLSKLVSIAKEKDIQKISGLTERQIQLLFYLILSQKIEFTYGELLRGIKDELKISYNHGTLSRALNKLAEKQVITWVRAENLQRDENSIIRLNDLNDIGKKLQIKKQVEDMFLVYEETRQKAQKMNEEEITYELIESAKNQAGASLYLKLLFAQGTFDEEQTRFGLILSNIFHDSIQDLYIEEVQKRGKKSIIEVLHHFLNSGIEVD